MSAESEPVPAPRAGRGDATWRKRLNSSRVLVFDFDGTLVDSVWIKQRAFDRCFKAFPEQREAIRAYCWGNNHTPRWEKFRYVYERILRLPYTHPIEQALLRRFERETTHEIARAPALPGVGEFLQWAGPRYPTALLSSTPHPVLVGILRKRGWIDRFGQVQGAPVNKTAWLKALARRGSPPGQILFFGDTPEDAAAARAAGCGFIPVARMRDFRRLL